MRRTVLMASVFVLVLAFAPVHTQAGTFFTGIKVWYETTWDSALLDIYAQMMEDALEESTEFYYENVDYDTFVGTGYMAGPILGYQSDDGKWSLSFAPMVVSSFKQDMHGTALTWVLLDDMLIPLQVNEKTSVDVSRLDLDVAASYSLAGFQDKLPLLKYSKLFLGFKYQKIEYEFKMTTSIMSLEDSFTEKFDYEVYMPTAGIGFVYPFTEDITAGIQAGIGIARFEGVNVDDGMAVNLEANVTISPTENLFIQFGYRYQKYSFELEPSNSDKTYESEDETYGPTLTLVYAF